MGNVYNSPVRQTSTASFSKLMTWMIQTTLGLMLQAWVMFFMARVWSSQDQGCEQGVGVAEA